MEEKDMDGLRTIEVDLTFAKLSISIFGVCK